jgi:hypothetical protein
MHRKLLIPVAAVALALLVAAVAILAGGHWYLKCTGSDGAPLGGIDCLGSTPRTDTHLARMFGFWPLVAAGWVALLALAGCGTVALVSWRRRRDRAGAALRRRHSRSDTT